MNKIWDKENNQLFLMLIICSISVYLLPVAINQIIFAILILYIFMTKKDYFWLVLFFILIDAPGRLFSTSTGGTELRLPIYPIAKGISLGFTELFTWAYLIKAIFQKRHLDFAFIRQFRWFYLFGALMVTYSLILGMDTTTLLITYRTLFPWSWVIIFPFFIRDETTLVKVSRLLFPFVFFALASQIFMYFTGMYLVQYFKGSREILISVSEEGEAIRSGSSGTIILFCFTQSFFYLLNNKSPFNKNYLIVIIITASISVLLSATRGWIIALIAIYLGIILFTSSWNLYRNAIRIVFISILLLSVLQFIFPVVGRQMDNAFLRLGTVGKLVQGDITAGGTLTRLDDRSPKVMKKFWDNPVLGWGFTQDFWDNADGHVGNQDLLLNVGIVGYALLIFIYFSISHTIWRWSKRPAIVALYGNSLRVFAIAMLGVFIIHSSSVQFWGYCMSGDPMVKTLFYAMLFSAVNAIIISSRVTAKPVIKTERPSLPVYTHPPHFLHKREVI